MFGGMGFIPDRLATVAKDLVNRPFVGDDEIVGLLESRASFGKSREWRHLVDRVIHQGQTNSCLAQFLSNATYLAGRAQESLGTGPRIARPSASWSYDVARLRAKKGPLVDLGCQPSMMMLGAQENGLVSEARYPFDPATINELPPFGVDTAAADARLASYHVTDEVTGFQDMCAALDVGHFPGFAIDVYENFVDASGAETYEDVEGQWIGLHMVTAVGFRPGAICILNSWGSGWGDEGYLWISEQMIRSHYVKYRTVMTAVPAVAA